MKPKKRDWRNQRKAPSQQDPMFSTRQPRDLIDRVKALVIANDSTQSVVVRTALEEFLERNENAPPVATEVPSPSLFD